MNISSLLSGKGERTMTEWVLPYIKQNKGRIALSVIFGFLGIASAAMLLFVSGYLISKSSLRPENIMIVYVPIVSVRAFSIGQALFPYLEKLMSHDIVLRILASYRKKLYEILEPQALDIQRRYQTGDILSVLSDDIEKLQDFYIRTLFPSVIGILVYGVIAIVFGFFDWIFMLLMVGLLGVIVFLIPIMSYVLMRKKHIAIKDKKGKLYQHITDAIFGQLDWVVSGRVNEVVHRITHENFLLMKKENNLKRWNHIRDALLRLIAGISIIAVMIWANNQVDSAVISPIVIAAFVLMMFSITDALLPISEAVEEIPAYVDSLQRIEKIQNQQDINNAPVGISHLQIQKPVVKLQNISYRYDDENKNIINNLTLTIDAGKKVAVLGKSGTGKSTLLKLLSGLLQPTNGTIMINDIKMTRSLLANVVSILNQKPHLFNTTIANNIRIGKSNATEAEIIEVLKQAQIYELIKQLPKGIHTQMDEMGKRFSGGERQRIAFARVLIQNTPIILMDEPTTGLDPETESELLKTILYAAKDKTIIWVTHHLAGAEWMDEIIFLESGEIKIRGSHVTLIKKNEYYRKLYEMDEGLNE